MPTESFEGFKLNLTDSEAPLAGLRALGYVEQSEYGGGSSVTVVPGVAGIDFTRQR